MIQIASFSLLTPRISPKYVILVHIELIGCFLPDPGRAGVCLTPRDHNHASGCDKGMEDEEWVLRSRVSGRDHQEPGRQSHESEPECDPRQPGYIVATTSKSQENDQAGNDFPS